MKRLKKETPSDIRLNKYIATAGVTSRRKADELILAGVVKINKKVVTDLGTKVAPGDFVTVNGDPVKMVVKYKYILLNKPKNFITTSSDDMGRKTVMDIVRSRDRVFPVGRLDRNTTGVLLLTNDGELANRLMHPKYRVDRTYIVGLDQPLKMKDAQAIADGVELEEYTTSPCDVLVDPSDNSKVYITLKEGKNREVRKIFEYFGYEVKRLDRKYYATLSVKGLSRGQYRHLDHKEVKELRKYVKLQ